MAVPRKKVTRAKRNMRRAHDSLTAGSYQECAKCGELHRPHHVCGACGHYNNREVTPVVEDDYDDEDAA